jgi:eukaryotic translation initiation factor 2C
MPKPVQKDQKAINVGSDADPVWYAAEMLRILPFQLYSRPVPDHLAQFMVEEAARSPAESQRLIENEGLSHLGFADVKDEAVRFVSRCVLDCKSRKLTVTA